MKLLQGGAPKCGNFWLYQIIQNILKRSGHDSSSFIEKQPIYQIAKTWDLNYPSQASIDVLEITDLQYSYRISSVYRMPIEDIKSYISQTNHVWTHSPICKRSPELFPLFDKKVYIVRDPRDRAISASKYYCSDYMLKYYPQEEKDPKKFLEKNFQKLMHEWVWHVFDHLRLSREHHIHISFYEGFLMDFQEELARLLAYLEIELSAPEKAALEAAMHFSSLQKQNPKHLKKGQSGYWMEQLTEEQIATAEAMAGPLIRFLGYPSQKGQPMSYNTEFPHQDFELLKQELLESQACCLNH
ncbi:MAG: sulfotransferase domain-containing protein [Hymenobacteraceae bacterium]|nr:sulfotransferase domain-containing protein [Hymenobacteraceae bacterium]MDX5394731.1 sulfotransferase domain-containing protein [Hymenobacteraceae bacterium]MDX5443525.1 sulfotransferase domain-containing protein [Hymenobacteraceae bacterium]MDX5510764.1 sulfotransferase domain-containing protein [Hymenobacteraceae bacterium]